LKGPSITNLAALGPFKDEVGYLTIRDTRVMDLQPLEGATVWHLDLRGSPITNLAVVTTMKHLDQLVLSRQQISENMGLLRTIKVLVGTNEHMATLPGGIAWKTEYEPPPPAPAVR
jgi:hypothetical protein